MQRAVSFRVSPADLNTRATPSYNGACVNVVEDVRVGSKRLDQVLECAHGLPLLVLCHLFPEGATSRLLVLPDGAKRREIVQDASNLGPLSRNCAQLVEKTDDRTVGREEDSAVLVTDSRLMSIRGSAEEGWLQSHESR